MIVSLLSIHSYPFEHPRWNHELDYVVYTHIYKSITMIQSLLWMCENTCLSLSPRSSNIESVAWQLRGRCFHGRYLDWKLILNVVDVTRWVLTWLRYSRLNRKKLRISRIFWYRGWIWFRIWEKKNLFIILLKSNMKRSIVWE